MERTSSGLERKLEMMNNTITIPYLPILNWLNQNPYCNKNLNNDNEASEL